MLKMSWNFGGGGEYLAAERSSLPHCEKEKICYTSDMKHHLKSIKIGFTLAEVLITLGIIGVVAALTIQNLVISYQKKETAEKLKVAFTLFSGALERAKSDYSDLYMSREMYKDFYLYRKTYIDPYLVGAKPYKGKPFSIYTSNGSVNTFFGYNNNDMCLPNGFCYLFKGLGGYNPDTDYEWVNYLYLIVDLNGPKKPNRVGRDIFYFALNVPYREGGTTKKVPLLSGYVYGASEKTTREEMIKDCRGDTSGWPAGKMCTLLIMNDGWEIKDDYPWK